jgi:hypothetical protein
MYQQLWGYKVEWKSVSRGTGGKKVEYHRARQKRFYSRRGQGVFLFTTDSRTALEPTQPPIEWLLAALSPRIKLQEREANH